MRRLLMTLVCAALVLAPSTGSAEMLSKKYKFRPGTNLEIGEDVVAGVRIDTVKFELPAGGSGRLLRLGGLAQAVVAISNTTKESRKVGIAVAVFDDTGRLLGVASGGSTVRGIRPFRQVGYGLVFDDVNAEIASATTFQITVEVRS